MAVRAERLSIRVMSWCALLMLVFGGWVYVWNGDGGGPLPVVVVVPLWALILAASAIASVVSAHVVDRFRFARWCVVVGATIATGLTVSIRRSILLDAGSVNDVATPSDVASAVDNGLTRAVSGQLTEVDTAVFGLLWAMSAVLFGLMAVLAARGLARGGAAFS